MATQDLISGRGVSAQALPKRIAIEYRPVSDLKPHPRNPKNHGRRQIRQLVRCIRRFGFRGAILVDSDGNIIAGHARWEAAKQCGMEEVPTICIDDLTEAEINAFRIADNKLTENGEWDQRLLAESLKELCELNLDFSADITGFEMGEIDVLIEGLAPSINGKDPGDQLPDLIKATRVTNPGDLWLLGKHRIYCGDARHHEAFEQLMNGADAAMAYIDPPFNIAIEDNVSGKGAIKHTNFEMACGEMSEQEFTRFLEEVCCLLKRYIRNGAIVFICMDWRHIGEVLAAGKNAFSEFKHLCVWAKDRASQGSFYRSQHELIFVFKNGKDAHINNIQLGQFGRYRTNVWQYPSAVSLARNNEEGNLLALHPTVKPVQMIADAIMDCSNRGDVILDSFLGSGTTVIAAERTGRICYGIEIDPHFVDVIVRRWQTFTGKVATHAGSGRSFAELEAEVKRG